MKQTHKKHVFHLRRVGLFAALFFALCLVRADSGSNTPSFAHANVLSYATEMSRDGLLSGTNAARAANGLGSLTLNAKLNDSAQAKAQDMASKNYWAHVAPDGTQPWYFFEQAGYSYTRAGENLAYGFTTSQGAVDGWMNSPTHRANILGEYVDVGFGIVNTPDYQSNGEETIVVAHYGTPVASQPAPAPVAPTTPAQPPQSTPAPPTPAPTTQPEPVAAAPVADTAKPVVAPTKTDPATNAQPTTSERAPAPVAVAAPIRITVLSMLATKNAPLAALASLLVISTTIVGYALTHRSAFQHAMNSGEHFVVAHPGIDTGVVAAITTLVLMTTYGHIG